MTKVSLRGNINYAAQVFKVPPLQKAENSDRLFRMVLGGMSVIVDASWIDREGQLMVVFPAESQLAFKLAHGANLHRHAELNKDQNDTGYLEDNLRVRAIRLRGNASNALALPLEKVASIYGAFDVNVGDVFDHIGDEEVVKKYELPVKKPLTNREEQRRKKVFKRVIGSMLPEHYDTANIRFAPTTTEEDAVVYVTQKLHGSSARIANVPTLVKPTLRSRVAKFFGVPVKDTVYDVIGGSRRVIKDAHDPYKGPGFYGAENDIWDQAVDRWGHLIPKGFAVYGELIGWAGDRPIQRGYTYNLPPGEMEFYVYRVAVITPDAEIVDLPWSRARQWCAERGFKTVPTLREWLVPVEFGVQWRLEEFLKPKAFYKDTTLWADDPVPLSEGGPGVDEGYGLRFEYSNRQPEFYKIKFPEFLEHETKVLDSNEEILS